MSIGGGVTLPKGLGGLGLPKFGSVLVLASCIGARPHGGSGCPTVVLLDILGLGGTKVGTFYPPLKALSLGLVVASRLQKQQQMKVRLSTLHCLPHDGLIVESVFL